VETEQDRACALVRGSCRNRYEVDVDWYDADSGTISVSCSCPRYAEGWLCKHIWATLLTLDREGIGKGVPGAGQLQVERVEPDDDEAWDGSGWDDDEDDDDPWHDDEDDDGPWDWDDDGPDDLLNEFVCRATQPVGPTGGRTAQRKTGRKEAAAGKPSWQKVFDSFRGDAAVQGGTANDRPNLLDSKKRRAWYVLDLGKTVSKDNLIIELFQQETKKNGEFGVVKALRLDEGTINSFNDPAERDLLALLVQFPHDPGYGDAYRYRNLHHHVLSSYQSAVSTLLIPKSLYSHLLPQMAATGRFVWALDGGQAVNDPADEQWKPVTWDGGAAWRFALTIEPDDTKRQWTITGRFIRDGESRPMQDMVLAMPTGLLMMDDALHRFDPCGAFTWLPLLNEQSAIEVPYTDREAFLTHVWSLPHLPEIAWPDNLRIDEVHETPRPRLKIHAPYKNDFRRNQLFAHISFLYGNREIKPSDRVARIVDKRNETGDEANGDGAGDGGGDVTSDDNGGGDLRILVRNRDHEAARLEELNVFPIRSVDSYNRSKGDIQFHKKNLTSIVDTLVANGWHVEAEGKLIRSPRDFRIEVTSGIDWFEMDAAFDFDGVQVKLPELLAAVRKGERYVELGDGTRGMLPEKWLARYADLADLGETEDGAVRFKPSQALLLDALLAEQDNLRVDRKFSRFRERLRSFDGVRAKDAPKTFHGTLRDYQRHGLGWLHFLREIGLGGCLADDMGLGKTIQVLALLDNRRTRRLKKGETRRPSLVVVPKSLVFNWIDEAGRFTPKLRIANYTGIDRKQRIGDFKDYHLVVTTYGTLRRDIVALKDCQFDYAILDESQAIKNASSQAAKASLLIDADNRLALTGTPIENHLGELWSLFEFLNPGMLGRSKAFASLCKSNGRDDRESLADLARAIAPFVLRRTKGEVLKELPEKTEQTIHCDLAPRERKTYNGLRDYYRALLAKKIDEKGLERSKMHVLEALLRLRQAACHPGLIDKNKAGQSSAKLDALLDQIREVVAEGHKALVFSQFTSLLAIVRPKLDKEGIRYEYLDGSTHNRKKPVEAFQNDPDCPLFLISLKAGGHGLNLTAADYVFILDPWWNPAVEAQAIDRTHRIGQTRRVFAYRIIARDTVEEKVLALQDSKRDLANAIITANDSLIRQLTADDLKMIFSPS